MICFLPFSHIPENPFVSLVRELGPLTIYLPAKALIPDRLKRWHEKGEVELHTPPDLDEPQLLGRLDAIKAWAQLHDGHISEMVHFFNTGQGRPPMIDETAPSQIVTQLRHLGEDTADTEVGELVQAALFLSLAQIYDQYQDKLGTELAAVAGMEQEMYTTIGGGADQFEGMGAGASGSGGFSHAEDLGGHMTAKRIQAWARIAFLHDHGLKAYVTSSAAVFEYLADLTDERVDLATWHLNRHNHHSELRLQRRKALAAVENAANINEIQMDHALCGQAGEKGWVVEWVGCAGFIFEKLLPEPHAAGVSTHTVLGLVRAAE